MTLEKATKTRILNLCQERGIAARDLASACKMPSTTISNLLSEAPSIPRVSTIERICDGLGITLAEFFVSDLFRNLDRS